MTAWCRLTLNGLDRRFDVVQRPWIGRNRTLFAPAMKVHRCVPLPCIATALSHCPATEAFLWCVLVGRPASIALDEALAVVGEGDKKKVAARSRCLTIEQH